MNNCLMATLESFYLFFPSYTVPNAPDEIFLIISNIMIPFYKLGSLFIRIFSKPIANKIKRYALNLDVNSAFPRRMFRYSFIRLGNQYNFIEVFVNRKLMGV